MNRSARLPIPEFYQPERFDQVWRVPYQERAQQARVYAREHGINPAAEDQVRVELVLIDVQNTFCLPDFALFVGGRSGTGAVDDNRRLSRFIYQNLDRITGITATMDTHYPLQIFHPLFWVDRAGDHPPANTIISHQDVVEGTWQVNPRAAQDLGIERGTLEDHLRRYTAELEERDKFQLMIWPYHAQLGGIGHALVSGIEEAVFFHSVARHTKGDYHLKGDHPLTEAYSAVGPEVKQGPQGEGLGERSDFLIQKVQRSDAVLIAGQAQSHCVAWTVSDLLEQIRAEDPKLVSRVFLMEDCTSPVVIPEGVDFTSRAEAAFDRFRQAGMNVVRSSTPLSEMLIS